MPKHWASCAVTTIFTLDPHGRGLIEVATLQITSAIVYENSMPTLASAACTGHRKPAHQNGKQESRIRLSTNLRMQIGSFQTIRCGVTEAEPRATAMCSSTSLLTQAGKDTRTHPLRTFTTRLQHGTIAAASAAGRGSRQSN